VPDVTPAAPTKPPGAAARRWQAIILASAGDGKTRRRASDAVRLAGAALVFVVSVAVIRWSPSIEIRLAHLLNSPPTGIHWLITVLWWFGALGVLTVALVSGLLSRRVALLRDAGAAALVTWVACLGAGLLLGSTGGRPPSSDLGSIDPGFPSVRIALTVGVAVAALPYLSRALRRLTLSLLWLGILSGLVVGACLPTDAIGSVAIGMAVAASVHLVFGSPVGLPSMDSVADALVDLGIAVDSVTPLARQVWGVARFVAHRNGPGPVPADGEELDVSVYGRDAADAQVLAKAYRFVAYRDSGPTLLLTRLQQVEHEAYLTLRAGELGVRVPTVVAAGYGGPSRDAVLVSAPPPGEPLGSFRSLGASGGTGGHGVEDRSLECLFDAMASLRAAKVAHGSLSPETIVVGEDGAVALRDFRCSSSDAPADRLDRDLAGALTSAAIVAGTDRTAAVAARTVPTDVLAAALPHLQPRALDPVTQRALDGHKEVLDGLRRAVADAAGIDMPELTELRRFSWGSVLMALGTVIGVWAMIGVLVNVAGSLSTLKGAAWGWVATAFVLSLFPPVVEAWALVASVFAGVPVRPVVALEYAKSFTGLVGGTPASLAVTIRFFQRRGADSTYAVTAGALNSAVSWIVKGALFLIAIPFAVGSWNPDQNTAGAHNGLVKLLLVVIIVIGVLAGIAGLVLTFGRRIRRIVADKIRPLTTKAFEPVRNLAKEPGKFAALIAGNTGSQLLTAFALGASLHAFGVRLSLPDLLFTITIASMLGGVSPVPGGMGVVEAGLIAGLVGFGVPEDIAVAAVFVQRLFTAYLPPIWGYATLVWLRHGDYL